MSKKRPQSSTQKPEETSQPNQDNIGTTITTQAGGSLVTYACFSTLSG